MRNPVMLAVWILGAAVALAIIVFVLANRTDIPVSLSPYPRLLVVPVYLVVVAAFAAGALFGGLFVWARGHAGRRISGQRKRRLKLLERELASSSQDVEALKAELDRRADTARA